MAELVIQYSTSTAFASGIIRRLCHSPFSHVDILIPGEGLLGVSGEDAKCHDTGGVLLRPFNPWPYKGPPKTARLKIGESKAFDIIQLARSQLGKPFDNTALWDFLSDKPGDRDWRNTESWFCSEFVIWCLEQGKFFSYPLVVAKNRVTPADSLLLLNPYLTYDNIQEFLT